MNAYHDCVSLVVIARVVWGGIVSIARISPLPRGNHAACAETHAVEILHRMIVAGAHKQEFANRREVDRYFDGTPTQRSSSSRQVRQLLPFPA